MDNKNHLDATSSAAILNVSDEEILKFIGFPLLNYIRFSRKNLPASLKKWISEYGKINGVFLSSEEVNIVYSRIYQIFIERGYAWGGPLQECFSGITAKGYEIAASAKISLSKQVGDKGEKTTLDLLMQSKIPGYTKFLSNVMIKGKRGELLSEIDILVINTHGIFIIENKEITGILKGNVNDNNWVRLNYNGGCYTTRGKSNMLSMKNPILQNRRHVNVLSVQCQIKKTKIYSFVVVTNHTEVKYQGNLKEREFIVKRANLIGKLLKCIKGSQVLLEKEEVDRLVEKLNLMRK